MYPSARIQKPILVFPQSHASYARRNHRVGASEPQDAHCVGSHKRLIELLTELAVADPDEAVRVVQCAVQQAMMVMRSIEEEEMEGVMGRLRDSSSGTL